MKELALIVCLHGDETLGLKIKNKLSKKIPTFIGNPKAIRKNKRFIDSDMNRIFPGKIEGNYEEKRADLLLKKLKDFRYVIDIHSSTCKLDLFGIITKANDSKIELAKKLGLKRLIIMSDKFASGKSLIDHLKCAISLEIGPHNNKENVLEIVNSIKKLKENINIDCSKNKIEILEIIDIIKGEKEIEIFIENLQQVKKGDLIAKGKNREYYADFDFVPIFVGERAYEEIICLAAKKI